MGVKDLWQILAPVCERKSLWELEGQTLAVDLSGWVCDSQNVAEYSSQPNMYLRNLFFRTSCLLLLGARPVFVLEGVAPDLKLNIMSQRNTARGLSSATSKQSGTRKQLKSVQKQCREMLNHMGVSCVESLGEAEAMCALLNSKGLIDGCITQDSDCFLYGGRVIYRNFTISASGGTGGPGFSVDVYRMDQIEEVLGLTRMKLIGLSLLCGCDYNQKGVSGVGKESAVKFITSLNDSEIFSRFQGWRNNIKLEHLEKKRTLGLCNRCGHYGKQRQHDRNGCEECHTSKKCLENFLNQASSQNELAELQSTVNELNIRKKALQDPSFPSQDIIDEYACVKDVVPKNFSCEWYQPNLIEFMKFAEKKLNWDDCYSLEKFLPVLTRWLLVCQSPSRAKCPVYPKTIRKRRVLKGINSYEVEWGDTAGLFDTIQQEGESDNFCVTVEPQDLFQEAFPKLTKEFKERETAKKEAKSKGRKRTTAKKTVHLCENCGREMPNKHQKCMCKFVEKSARITQKEKTLEEMLDCLKLNRKEQKDQSKLPDDFVKRSAPTPQQEKTLEEMLDGLKLNKRKQEVQSKLRSVKPESSLKYSKKNYLELEKPDTVERKELNHDPCESKTLCLRKSNELTLGVDQDGSPNNYQLHDFSPILTTPSLNCYEKKFSYEDLLPGEKCSAADFVDLKELNLSDVVQSITGRHQPNLNFNRQEHSLGLSEISLSEDEDSISSMTGRDVNSPLSFNAGQNLTYSSGSLPLQVAPHCQSDKTPSSVKNNFHNSSSDEEYPYTPLMDRVFSLRDKKVSVKRRSSILPSPQASRFSKSFDTFCSQINRTLSSPKWASEVSGTGDISEVETESVTFSLGISDLLQNSNLI